MSAPRTNVLFLMIQMSMGGSERLVLNLVKHLDRDRFAPSIGWLTQGEPLEEFQQLDVPLYCIPKHKRLDWTALSTLGRIVRDQRIDIINAHHFMPFFYASYAARVATRTGLVYTEHSESDVMSASGKWQTIGRCLLRSCDAAIGVSDRVSTKLASHFRVCGEKVHTIENGADLGLLEPRPDERRAIRERFGFSPDDVFIGHVANFRRNKNHLFLLRAFHDVARDDPAAKLVLVGQGFANDPENSEPEIRNYIQDHGLSGRVHLTGYRSDVPDLLRMLDVFCLTSYKEGLPLSLIEAMAAGLPVVGTDIDAIRTVIEPGVNGFVVAPDDVPSLAQALRRLIRDADARGRMGAASRRLAMQKYSLKRCVDSTERLFLDVLAERSIGTRAEAFG